MGISGPAAAQAQNEPGSPGAGGLERRPALAQFEGRTINLAEDWGEAQACLVWRQGGVLECFRTPEALDARESQLDPARRGGGPSSDGEVALASFSWYCESSLRLFDYTWYGGRQLSFWDRGYWQNLWDYGFDDRTSSYIVGACAVYLADYGFGGGDWYWGPTYPYAGEPVMSWDWQNAVSSIYIT